nr:F40F12.5 protein - Caenorhabditis elegans [Caenorhabditis elegans]
MGFVELKSSISLIFPCHSGSSSVAPSNSRLYYSPNQMHMPMKGGGVSALYDNRRLVQYSGDEEQYRSAPKPAPRERIIPVSRQQPEIEQRNSRSMKPSEPDYNTYSTHPPRPPPSSSMNYPSMSNTHSLQPSRSKSVQTIQRNQFVRQNPAERNERVESDQLNFRIGDQCIWNNNGAEERGIIKYIGFLKGHKTLYAGSHVVVRHLGAQRTGVVRWLGEEIDDEGDRIVRSAIVQLDEDVPTAWRRSHDASSYTGSPVVGGVLVPIQSLKHNHSGSSSNGASVVQTSTYPTSQTYNNISRRTEDFGSMDSGVEKQKCGIAKDMQQLVGRQKGIQGYCNSCYLDATLYAMFVQTTCFDFLLEKSIKGSETAQQFQKILAHEIVFPLRKVHYVRADHVMKLRKLLAELMPHVTGLTNEEKDPEEILGFIFSKVFHAEPFIKLIGQNHAKDSQYLVPIVVDDWLGGAATSQHLLERHMRSAQVTFAKAPPVLIMQLPRYGQQKVFDKILPLETIDITPFVAGAVPACSKCQACSEVYCPTCFLTRRVFYSEVIFCRKCFHHTHLLPEIEDHKSRDLYPPGKPQKKPHSHKMVLSAVLCIETSHYVAYVRTSSNQWVFFDSMADREGLSDGFNVPVVRECGNMSDWLSLQGWNRLKDADECGQIKVWELNKNISPNDRKLEIAMFGKQSSLDPLVGRLLSDSYICFYEDASPTSSSSSSSTIISSIKNMMN